MKIALSGVETTNKGSELMIYAILNEIEKRFPDAEVYVEADRVKTSNNYLQTNLTIRRTNVLKKVLSGLRINWILQHLHLPIIKPRIRAVKNCDYYLNAIGFHFSDQWKLNDSQVNDWKKTLEAYKNENAKIVFLPQAFGPIDLPNTKKVLQVISDNADLIFPRENVSFKYLEDSGVVDMSKVRLRTDFTSHVHGVVPTKYEYLKNGVCIIPNMRMIDKGTISFTDYLSLISQIITTSKANDKPVYLLCHEGKKDEELAKKIAQAQKEAIDIVKGLNALEIKGLISTAFLVISSRFHGVASALNSCVPCLATSWSHKYAELFNDYGQKDCVLPLNDIQEAMSIVMRFVDQETNNSIREQLQDRLKMIQEETTHMWDETWGIRSSCL